MFSLLPIFVLLVALDSEFYGIDAFSGTTSQSLTFRTMSTTTVHMKNGEGSSEIHVFHTDGATKATSRREMIQEQSTKLATAMGATASLTLLPFQRANAETSSSSSSSTSSKTQLLDKQTSRFKRVPLFAIVSSTTGTPFMILQNTGRAQAYFFTTYEGAKLVLDDAIRDASDKDLATVDMWNTAKISAVNLEFVLKLNKGRLKATAQNNVKYEAVYDVIPSILALNEAEKIDRSGMYSERGRVPLFYANDFQIESSSEADVVTRRIPVFFEKADLLREYSKKYPEREDVVITVVDLMDSFEVMMGNKPIGAKVDDAIIDRMVFVPSVESRKKAVECEKERGSIPAYKIGEMIAVGGK